MFIIGCVFLIAFGESTSSMEESEYENPQMNLVLAVIMALVTGLVFGLQNYNIKKIIMIGFDIDQASYDGNLMLGLIFLGPFIYNFKIYTLTDILLGNAVIFLVSLGVIFIGRGISHGNGGPVSAIENSKSVVQTIWAMLWMKFVPSGLQIAGLIAGLVGVIFIVI